MFSTNTGTVKNRNTDIDIFERSSSHSGDNFLVDECPYESHTVVLARSPGFGFGFALSGGVDEPPIENGGDRSVYVSDVLRSGPADGRLRLFDRIVSVNGISLAGTDNATAVGILKDAGSVVNLVIRRRQSSNVDTKSGTTFPAIKNIALHRKNKAQDFGLVLGVRLYVKGILPNSPATGTKSTNRVQEGDIILKINDISTEDLTLNEARKVLEKAKDRLDLTVLPVLSTTTMPELSVDNTSISNDGLHYDNSSVTSWSLSSLNTRPVQVNGNGSAYNENTLTSTRSATAQFEKIEQIESPRMSNPEVTAPTLGQNQRLVSFCKEGSVGIRLVGGNRSGIYIADVQPGSVAAAAGLVSGDHIISVNEYDYRLLTREEAVMHLLQAGKIINMIVNHQPENMTAVLGGDTLSVPDGLCATGGDSFYVRANFDHPAGTPTEHGQLLFRHGDILHVTDTLYNGTIGCWFAARLSQNNMEVDRGIIPNLTRAEQMRLVQKRQLLIHSSAADSNHSSGAFGTLDRASAKLFGKRREPRRAKSLSRDYWESVANGKQEDNAIGGSGSSSGNDKRPAYERVRLIEPGAEFRRPIVVYGPVGDLARHRLTTEFPAMFESPIGEPHQPSQTNGASSSKVIRLRAIRQVMERGRHAVLDITPNSVDKLVDAGFHPIVIFVKASADQRQFIKDAQQRLGWHSNRTTKKLLSEASRLESSFSHLFSALVSLTASDQWFVRLRQAVELCQNTAIWVPDCSNGTDESARPPMVDSNGNYMIPNISGNPYVMPNCNTSIGGDGEDEEDEEGVVGGGGRWKQSHPFATIRHMRSTARSQQQKSSLAQVMSRQNGNATVSASALNPHGSQVDTPGSYATLPSRRALPPPPPPPPTASASSQATTTTPMASSGAIMSTATTASSHAVQQSLTYGNAQRVASSEYANFATIRSPSAAATMSVRQLVAETAESVSHSNNTNNSHAISAALAVAESVSSDNTADHRRASSNVISSAQQSSTPSAAASNGTPTTPPSAGGSGQEGERVYPSFYAESLSNDQRQTIAAYGTLSRPRKTSRSSLLAQTDFRSPIVEAKELENGISEDFFPQTTAPSTASTTAVNYASMNIIQQNTGSHYGDLQNIKVMQSHNAAIVESGRQSDGSLQMPPSPASASRYASLHLVPRPYRRPPNATNMLHGEDGFDSPRSNGAETHKDSSPLLKMENPAQLLSSSPHENINKLRPTPIQSAPKQTNNGTSRTLWQNVERAPSSDHLPPCLKSVQHNRDVSGPTAGTQQMASSSSSSSDPLVLDTIRASADYAGGVLESKSTGVSLNIPRGALPPVSRQEVYFRVCTEPGAIASLQQQAGGHSYQQQQQEHSITPVVMCGPPGLVFRRQVELRLPRAVRLRLSPVPSQPPTCYGPVDADQIMSVFIDHF